jgi:hypothetical protein
LFLWRQFKLMLAGRDYADAYAGAISAAIRRKSAAQLSSSLQRNSRIAGY